MACREGTAICSSFLSASNQGGAAEPGAVVTQFPAAAPAACGSKEECGYLGTRPLRVTASSSLPNIADSFRFRLRGHARGRTPAAAASETSAASFVSASGSRRICDERQQEQLGAKECRGEKGLFFSIFLRPPPPVSGGVVSKQQEYGLTA